MLLSIVALLGHLLRSGCALAACAPRHGSRAGFASLWLGGSPLPYGRGSVWHGSQICFASICCGGVLRRADSGAGVKSPPLPLALTSLGLRPRFVRASILRASLSARSLREVSARCVMSGALLITMSRVLRLFRKREIPQVCR